MQSKYLGTGAESLRKIFERNSNIHVMMPVKLYLEESQEPGIVASSQFPYTITFHTQKN